MLKQMETTEVTVGDYTYYIMPYPAMKAANMSAELANIIAPIIGTLAPLMQNGNLADTDLNQVGGMFTALNLNGDKVESLIKKLLIKEKNVSVKYEDENGDEVVERLTDDLVNALFSGNVQNMFILCFHVIRLNFKGFFSNIPALSGNADTVAEKTPRPIY